MIQPLFGGNFNNMATTGTQYAAPVGGEGWSASVQFFTQLFPIDGTLSNLRILLNGSPGAGTSHIFTLFLNGADTAMVVTISDAETSGVYSGDIAISAGDYVSLKHTVSGTPTARKMAVGVKFDSGSGGAIIMGNHGDSPSDTNTEYAGLMGSGGSWDATITNTDQICSVAGTLQNLRVRLFSAPGTGNSIAFTVMVNGVASTLTLTISGTDITGADTSNTVAVAAGDTLALRSVPSSTPTVGPSEWGLELDPTIDGESPQMLVQNNGTISNASVNYGFPTGQFGDWNGTANQTFSTTESSCRSVSSVAFTMKDMHFSVNTAPGSGNSWTLIGRINGADTAITTSISGTATVATPDTTNDVSVADNVAVALNLTPASSPTSGVIYRFSFVAFVSQVVVASRTPRLTLLGVG